MKQQKELAIKGIAQKVIPEVERGTKMVKEPKITFLQEQRYKDLAHKYILQNVNVCEIGMQNNVIELAQDTYGVNFEPTDNELTKAVKSLIKIFANNSKARALINDGVDPLLEEIAEDQDDLEKKYWTLKRCYNSLKGQMGNENYLLRVRMKKILTMIEKKLINKNCAVAQKNIRYEKVSGYLPKDEYIFSETSVQDNEVFDKKYLLFIAEEQLLDAKAEQEYNIDNKLIEYKELDEARIQALENWIAELSAEEEKIDVSNCKFHILVAGSRTIADKDFVFSNLDSILKERNLAYSDVEIIEGAAQGVDSIAAQYARINGCGLSEFPANWKTYNAERKVCVVDKGAGYKRNAEMHDYLATFPKDSRLCVCFWDGESGGTQHNFKLAVERDTELKVFRP